MISNHALDRAAERIGRNVSRAEWLALVASIVDRRVPLLERRANGCEVYLGAFDGVNWRVVWSPKTAAVVTVLPMKRCFPPGYKPGASYRTRGDKRPDRQRFVMEDEA